MSRQQRTNDRPMSVADLVEAVHEGRIGHAEAIARLNLTSFAQLVDTMHLHGLALWGHRPVGQVPVTTLDILAEACGLRPPAHPL